MLRTPWTPYGLCCLHSGEVAVTFFPDGKVVIYNRCGKIIQELDEKLLRPYQVAQNKVNNDLYVCDKNSFTECSSGKVVALDASYHSRYEYTGQDNAEFYPMDLCTDSAGHVLITDYKNHRVHILDKDGRFLQYLLTREQGLLEPVSIDVDSKGKAWVGQRCGEVTVVKYLK